MVSGMATEYFLVINGIAGDYVDLSGQLTGAFKVNSFDYPTSNAGSAQTGAAKTSFDPLKLSLDSETLAGLLAAEAAGSSKLQGTASLVGRTTTREGDTFITSSLNL